MIPQLSACYHPPADTLRDLYCSPCGILKIDGTERSALVHDVLVCVQGKRHQPAHRAVATTSTLDAIALLASTHEW